MERTRLEQSLLQTSDRLAQAEDRVVQAQKRAEEAREAREQLRQRMATTAAQTDKLVVEAEVARGLHRDGENERAALRKAGGATEPGAGSGRGSQAIGRC